MFSRDIEILHSTSYLESIINDVVSVVRIVEFSSVKFNSQEPIEDQLWWKSVEAMSMMWNHSNIGETDIIDIRIIR